MGTVEPRQPVADAAKRSVSWPAVAQALGAAAISLAIAGVGNRYTAAIKQREVEARFVELALAILQAPPDSATRNLRSWAIRVVNQYSNVPLDSSVARDLRDSVPLPFSLPTAISSGAAQNTGLRAGDSVWVRLNLAARSTVRWSRVQRPGFWTTVDRPLGPGVDSFAIGHGGTLSLRVLSAAGDSVVVKEDCSRGCMIEVR